MDVRSEVVAELRTMFADGATPSRLIRWIAERHEGERELHLLVQMYFLEAFEVPIVRGLNPIDDYREMDLSLARLNRELIPQMINGMDEWRDSNRRSESWLDGMKLTSDAQGGDQIRCETIPDLKRCWPLLNSDEQQYIQAVFRGSHGQFEAAKALSQLAERLQQRVLELEAEREPILTREGSMA